MKTKATILTSVLTVVVCSVFFLLVTEESPPVIPEPVASVPDTLEPVVSTTWLAERLGAPDLITLHVGSGGSYRREHIPGARNASLRRLLRENDIGIRDEMLEVEDIADVLEGLGIGDSSRVVIYFSEENSAWAAARYLLTLEYIGMAGRVAYLDGGLPKWVAEQRPVSSNTPSFEPDELAAQVVTGVIVDTEWLRARFEQSGIAIVDGRPAEFYSGSSGEGNEGGHIPGAANIPFSTLLADDPPYLLRSREELSGMFREAGAEVGDTVVAYCGTGLWGSLPYLAARYLGYEVRLYDGSFQEWSMTDDLPIVIGGSRN